MPTYVYRFKDTGETVERVMTIREMERFKRRPRIDGRAVERCLEIEHAGFAVTPSCWPMKSEAAGVHPTQVADAYEEAKRNGVPTDFTKDGRAIFRDRDHRRRYLKSIGLHDRNGGYSD